MPAPKAARRQHRVTISDDMGAVWDWFKGVPPRAAAGEIEFLLRLGVLTAASVRGVGSQAGQGADGSTAVYVPALPAPVSPGSADAQLHSATTAEDAEIGVAQADGWNFLHVGFDAAVARR